MPIKPAPGEQFTVRRKVFKLFGAAFHVYDADNKIIGYCKQKAFKLKEDFRVYTDESCSTELLVMQARQVLDFGATYDVTLPTGEKVGSFRRKGLKSSFVRDEWLVFDAEGTQIALLQEKGSMLALLRRYIDYVAIFVPQRYELFRTGEQAPLVSLRQHFNLFVYRLGVTIHRGDDHFDELLVLAMACLIGAIEGRQS
ncbi:MAG: hypothetical protein R3B49_06720 [Phycisphaerales bacterium]